MNVFDPIIKNLGIDWKIFLAQLVNFGIVFFVLKKFAFSPIQKLLKERQSKIEKGLDDAARSASELSRISPDLLAFFWTYSSLPSIIDIDRPLI